MGKLIPQLAYEDIGAALEFLAKAFGFRDLEELHFSNDDGSIGHAEMEVSDGERFMLGQAGGHGTSAPRQLGGLSAMIAVYVDDVEAHLAQARAAGAKICAELEDKPWGDRSYEAEDPAGHRWMFCQKIREVPPEEWTGS